MVFDNISFIKANHPFHAEYTGENIAPLFRKKFCLENTQNAKLYVAGLGIGYYYINGKKVSHDLFTAPTSNYNHTVWYNTYDVSALLQTGENVIAAELGNGWLNEEIKTYWEQEKANWRDNPKLILALTVGDEVVVKTDESWKCQPESATFFNQFRCGEFFDARKYDPAWAELDYDDSDWAFAIIDDKAPKGVFRECLCEPIRETDVYKPQAVTKIGDSSYAFDMGQNFSGYIRLRVTKNAGDLLTIKYDEDLRPAFSLRKKINRLLFEGEFATDKVICSGKPIIWSPKFTYHGFRYITVTGISSPDEVEVEGVFVHQDVARKTTFQCSDPFLNSMFHAGIMASYSNMFYMLTDCPTREKYGWTNDAQSSCEQMLTNFKIENLLTKWLQDIYDAMREDGNLPGIIPTPEWGYEWGSGPFSGGILFEIPLRVYMHTGNSEPLVRSLEYFDRYLAMLEKNRDENGLVAFGLGDWANPGLKDLVSAEFINAALMYEFYGVAALAASLKGIDPAPYQKKAEAQKACVLKNFIAEDGRCTVDEQAAIAILIYFDLYTDLDVLKQQLLASIERENYHHTCGMVGLRRLLLALNKCGLEEVAYKVLTVDGYPGYKVWFNNGATTLWEHWSNEEDQDSKNHHMYSDFLSWIIKTLLGLSLDYHRMGKNEFVFDPKFLEDIDFAKGTYTTDKGDIIVNWKKEQDRIFLSILKPAGVIVRYQGAPLKDGINQFEI